MMSTVTAREYEDLARAFTEIEVIETDGMLITRAYLPPYGYVLALEPFGGRVVTLLWDNDFSPSLLKMICP